jgi:hypothetical protein
MFEYSEEPQPRPPKDLFLIFSMLALGLFTAAFLWVALSNYRNRIDAISLSESRFLTMEWRLLRELKEATDQKLLEKEQEIEDLNKRYLRLVKGDAASEDMRQIETRLRQARSEREEILSQRSIKLEEASPRQKSWLAELLPSDNRSILAVLQQKQIESLEAERANSRLRIEMLEKELAALDAKHEASVRDFLKSTAESQDRIHKLSAAIAESKAAARAVFEALKREAPETDGRELPLIEDLNTRAFVRALASSPAIRSEYPNLLKSLDRYFEVYGRQERLKARREAYTSAAAAVEALARAKELP